jgi:predicted component of type VI protein secretion system
MYSLTLYHDSDPAHPIGSRLVEDGVMRIGRDTSSDWVLDDPDCLISRQHLEIRLRDGVLLLCALGRNGVYLGEPPKRAPDDVEVTLTPGDCLALGTYRMKIAECDSDMAPSTSLLEAFCDGAQIDSSRFIADDPVTLMREAGAVYRQLILGLNELLAERSGVRSDIGVDRTTIGVRSNNLLKWSPAQRAAVDLLVKKDAAFLAGADAISAAFGDVKKHLIGLMAGHHSAMRALLDSIRPARLSGDARHRLLRGADAAAWERFVAAHAELERQLAGETEGVIRRGFMEGYDDSGRDSSRSAA